MDIINHGCCEHILDKCTYRDIVYYDLFSNKNMCLRFCNEWFRLNYIMYFKSKTNNSDNVNNLLINDFISELILESVFNSCDVFVTQYYEEVTFKAKDPFNSYVFIKAAKRPNLFYKLKLIDLIKIKINDKFINSTINETILNWLLFIKKNAKLYNAYNPKIITNINQISKNIYNVDLFTTYLNELLINILNSKKCH